MVGTVLFCVDSTIPTRFAGVAKTIVCAERVRSSFRHRVVYLGRRGRVDAGQRERARRAAAVARARASRPLGPRRHVAVYGTRSAHTLLRLQQAGARGAAGCGVAAILWIYLFAL